MYKLVGEKQARVCRGCIDDEVQALRHKSRRTACIAAVVMGASVLGTALMVGSSTGQGAEGLQDPRTGILLAVLSVLAFLSLLRLVAAVSAARGRRHRRQVEARYLDAAARPPCEIRTQRVSAGKAMPGSWIAATRYPPGWTGKDG
jgi:hypothetical protein